MRTNQIYTAYVSWGLDGKRRPVLIVEDQNKNIFCYRINRNIKKKSKKIKKN
ncbi:MazF family toxin-antitoxin system, partial [Limosilactobacillus reuteri]